MEVVHFNRAVRANMANDEETKHASLSSYQVLRLTLIARGSTLVVRIWRL